MKQLPQGIRATFKVYVTTGNDHGDDDVDACIELKNLKVILEFADEADPAKVLAACGVPLVGGVARFMNDAEIAAYIEREGTA